QAQVHGDAAVPPDQCMQGVGIGGRDLAAGENVVGTVQVHDLVARAHEGDPWGVVDERGRVGNRCEDAELGRADRAAGAQNDVPFSDVFAPVADVLPGVPAGHHPDAPGL